MELDTVLIAGLACFFLVAPILDRIGLGPGLALAITGLLVAWLVATGADTETVRFTAIESLPRWIAVLLAVLLVPWVFRHGVELGRLCRGRFSVADLVPGGARVAITVIFVGALAYLWFPWGSWRQPDPGPDRWLASLLLAAAWAIPATTLRLTTQTATRLEGRHLDQGAWSALLGIVAFTSLLIGFRAISADTGTLSAGETGTGGVGKAMIPAILAVASGIVSGVAGSFLGRLVGRSRWRVLIDLATAYVALLLAGLVSGAEVVAPFFAGATRGFLSLTAGEPESDSARLFWRHTGTLTMGVVFILAAEAVAISLFDVEVFSLALTLWGAGLIVQLLVSGALVLVPRRGDSFRRSWAASLALGWGYHPGALAVGLAAAGGLLTNGELELPERFAATFFAVVLVASLLQGATAPLFFKLFRPPDRASWNRWREQDGFRVALSACFRELDRLHANGLVGDDQAESIRRVLQGELRDLDVEQSDVLSRSPELERLRWTHALELLLVSAGAAVARASESGHVPAATAARVRKRLAERIDRLSELSVDEILRRPTEGHDE